MRALRDIDSTMIPTMYRASAVRGDGQTRASAYIVPLIFVKIDPFIVGPLLQDGEMHTNRRSASCIRYLTYLRQA
jgi:hypothetical protein